MAPPGVIADSQYRNVQIAAAVISFAGLLIALFGRSLIMWCFGLKHVHIRKPMLTYWKIMCFSAFVAEMLVLFTLGETERVTGSGIFFNWSRWPFYTISLGVGFLGMLGIYQQHALYWTRWYVCGYAVLMGLFATWNAFAEFKAQRDMLFGFQALGFAGYIAGLFWFDERADCSSRLVSIIATACITVIAAGFITGHANVGTYGRFHEAIFYIVPMAITQILMPALIVPFCYYREECKAEGNVECQPMCAQQSQQQ